MAANRFKKSIETAIDNTQESIIINAIDDMKNDAIDIIQDNAVENIIDNKAVNIQTSVLSKTGGDILKKVLESEKKNKGGNHTIYLSADVGEALVRLAKKSKKSKSTLVDEILREVLLNQ